MSKLVSKTSEQAKQRIEAHPLGNKALSTASGAYHAVEALKLPEKVSRVWKSTGEPIMGRVWDKVSTKVQQELDQRGYLPTAQHAVKKVDENVGFTRSVGALSKEWTGHNQKEE